MHRASMFVSIPYVLLLIFGNISLQTLAQSCSETVVGSTVDCTDFALHHGRLKLNGRQLVDAFGDIVQLRGISSHGLQFYPDCVTKDSIAHHVTTWGINVFRIVVYIDAVENGYEVNAGWFDQFIVKIVRWCKELGIYAIIDWHVLASGDPNAHLDSQGADTGLAVDFWTKYATLYKDETHVLYEIANEPNHVTWNTVLDYHNSIISVIRAIDPEAIIIAGTTSWSQEIDLAYATPVDQPYNVMYSFHFHAATHSNLLPLFEQYLSLMPLFVSEWRIGDASGFGAYDPVVAAQYLDKCAGVADITSTVVSWTQWSLADKADTSSLLEPDSCSARAWDETSCQGKYTENYLKDKQYVSLGRQLACDGAPSSSPTVSARPSSSLPSGMPSSRPSEYPSSQPSVVPTSAPSISFAPTAERSTNSVSVEDIIGPSGAYIISFVVLCLIGIALYWYLKHYREKDKKSGEADFQLASTTFEAAPPQSPRSKSGRTQASEPQKKDIHNAKKPYNSGDREIELGRVSPPPESVSLVPPSSSHALALQPRQDPDENGIDLSNIYACSEDEGLLSLNDTTRPQGELLPSPMGGGVSRSPMVPPSPQKPITEDSVHPPHPPSKGKQGHSSPPAQTQSTRRKSPPPQRSPSNRKSPAALERKVSSMRELEKKKPTRNTRTVSKK